MSPMIAMAPCFGCSKVFGFNPDRVPSIRSPATGQRIPICPACVARANLLRQANGLAPIEILPGAYDAEDEFDQFDPGSDW